MLVDPRMYLHLAIPPGKDRWLATPIKSCFGMAPGKSAPYHPCIVSLPTFIIKKSTIHVSIYHDHGWYGYMNPPLQQFCINLRKIPTDPPGTYPMYPKNHQIWNSQVVEGLGYVPGVCWTFLPGTPNNQSFMVVSTGWFQITIHKKLVVSPNIH